MYYSTLHNINLFPKDQHRNYTMGERPGTVFFSSYTYIVFVIGLYYTVLLYSPVTLALANTLYYIFFVKKCSSKPKAITNLKLQYNEYFHQKRGKNPNKYLYPLIISTENLLNCCDNK